ncbi:MAG: hypothetical protein L0154_07845, partial [Chloroflexi bacterium]|nr:hypothetical protein [Chloroflexota bacterium]
MMRRYPNAVAMQEAVLTTPGATAPALRRHIVDYACDPDNYPVDAIPEDLRTYIEKVVRYAYRI